MMKRTGKYRECPLFLPHADPAARIIAATALSLGATLMTKDDKLRSYPHLKTVW